MLAWDPVTEDWEVSLSMSLIMAEPYYISLYFSWWDFVGVIIHDPKMGGIDPIFTIPNPDHAR